jgi:hypothetical protein
VRLGWCAGGRGVWFRAVGWGGGGGGGGGGWGGGGGGGGVGGGLSSVVGRWSRWVFGVARMGSLLWWAEVSTDI